MASKHGRKMLFILRLPRKPPISSIFYSKAVSFRIPRQSTHLS